MLGANIQLHSSPEIDPVEVGLDLVTRVTPELDDNLNGGKQRRKRNMTGGGDLLGSIG